MSTQPDQATQPSPAELKEQIEELQAKLDDIEEAQAEDLQQQPKMVIVALNGTLDMAYPTLILSSLAAAMDWDVTVFASFWALDMLHEEKSKNLKLSSVANPHMPIPNALGVLPGMDGLATRMMKKKIADEGVDTVEDMIRTAIDNGVEFQACQMTADLMDYEEDDFIEGVRTGVGAGTALMAMSDSDIQMVI